MRGSRMQETSRSRLLSPHSMRIVALLSGQLYGRLVSALGGEHALANARSVAEALTLCERTGAELLVFDPSSLPDRMISRLLTEAVQFPLEILFYAPITLRTVRTVLGAAKQGVGQLAILGADDDSALLRLRVKEARIRTAPARLLERLAPSLQVLPPAIQKSAIVPLTSSSAFQNAVDFARANCLCRRTLDRRMIRAGLRSAACLLSVARLAHAWNAVTEREERISAASRTAGFASEATYRDQHRQHVGLSPAAAVRDLTIDAFINCLAGAALGKSDRR